MIGWVVLTLLGAYILFMFVATLPEACAPKDWYGNPIEEEPDPLRIVCPKCGAGIGVGCTHLNKKPTLTHVIRRREEEWLR